MFRITADPPSESPVQCLAKNDKNDSVVFVDMDKVRVMAAYSDPLCVYMKALPYGMLKITKFILLLYSTCYS